MSYKKRKNQRPEERIIINRIVKEEGNTLVTVTNLKVNGRATFEVEVSLRDVLPPLMLLMLGYFLEKKRCWKLDEGEPFRQFEAKEVRKMLQALHTVGLLNKENNTCGSRFETMPAGRKLLEMYWEVVSKEQVEADEPAN